MILRDLKARGYERVGKSQVVDAYEYLLGLDVTELVNISKDKSQPMLLYGTAQSLLSQGLNALNSVMDRVHGRPTQPLGGDQTNPLTITLKDFTDEQLTRITGRHQAD